MSSSNSEDEAKSAAENEHRLSLGEKLIIKYHFPSQVPISVVRMTKECTKEDKVPIKIASKKRLHQLR